MGFRMMDREGKGGFARVWKVEDKGKYSEVQLSTSKKNKDGTYETDFQDGFVRFIGAAHNKIKDVDIPEKGLTIQITLNDTTTNYSQKTKTKYVNYVVFDFEVYDGSSGSTKSETNTKTTTKVATKKKEKTVVEDTEEDLPF